MKKNTLPLSQISLSIFPRHIYILILFSLLILMSWISISYYLYDIHLYYLHQIIPTFANILNIFLLFILIFSILYIFDYIYCYFFKQKVTLSIYQDGLSISTTSSNDFFAWQDISCFELKQSNHHSISFKLITISPIRAINFYFKSWLQPPFTKKAMTHRTNVNLNPFWDKLEHHTRNIMQKSILKNESQQNNVIVSQLTINQDINKRLQRKHRRIAVIIAITISILSIFICITLLWQEFSRSSINRHGQEQSFSGTNFKAFDDEVYIFKQGEGYFLLPNIKTDQFTGLALENLPQRADELYSNVGKTLEQVYWQEHILEKLTPEQVKYLGNDYTKDHRYVYFQDKLLLEGDAQSFDAILHPIFNTLGYFYAKDKQQVYYKTHALKDLHPQHVQVFNNTNKYIYDQSHIYYEDQKLYGLNPFKTQIFVGSNRFSHNLNLASDEHFFYFNAQPLRNIAYYKFAGTKLIKPEQLNILGIQSNNPYPGNYNFIFADHDTIYVYDEFYQRLQILYQFKETGTLQILADRHFTYGKESYRITNTLLKTKGARSSGSTTHGFKIKLIRERDEKVMAQYFARNVYQFSPKNIFE